jgi:hypothetical protein
MKRTTMAGVLLGLLPAFACANDSESVNDIAAATGLTRSEVQMVLGARTPFFEYMTSYARAQERMVAVLGEQRYRELMAGRPVVLGNGRRLVLAQH